MKRRVLILTVLVGLLVVLVPKQATEADNCTCWDDYASCLDDAVTYFENCASGAESARDSCLFINTTQVCQTAYDNDMGNCEVAFWNSEYSCDSALNTCLSSCNGGGGGGASGICNISDHMGYSSVGASFYGSFLSSCISDGGSAFTESSLTRDGFDTCMSGTGGTDQTFCCRAQIDALIEANAGCNLDPRNSDCKKCVTY
jgi:hypothetical protein